jgi:membrane associated rhomboid family serine protease
MGQYDRDYYRSGSQSALGGMRLWSFNTWIIVVNVVVFLLDGMSNGLLSNWGSFTLEDGVYRGQIWRFITFQFLHANPTHIFFNMFSLYFFGRYIEAYLGSRRYLAFYLLSGIGGALGYIVLYYAGLLGSHSGSLIGASAGIFGVLIAAARLAPNARVLVMVFPMQLRQMVWIFIAIAVYTIFTSGPNAGGEAAHLGGAVVGFLLIRNERLLNFADYRWPRKFSGDRNTVFKDWR